MYFGTEQDAFRPSVLVDIRGMAGKAEWWYAGETCEAHGPVCTAKLAELFLDGVMDGLSISQDGNLTKDQGIALGDVAAIRDEIAGAGRVDDAEGEGTGKETADVTEKLGSVAKKNCEAASSVEETEPTASQSSRM